MKRLSNERTAAIARRARAMGDPTRIRILEVLGRGPRPVGKIADALEARPYTISKHLQVLFQAGLVERRRAASEVIYSLSDANLPGWCHYLGTLGPSGRTNRS